MRSSSSFLMTFSIMIDKGESGQLHLRHTDTTPLSPHFRFANHKPVVDTSSFVNEA